MAPAPARLVLVTPPDFDPADFARQLSDALQTAETAAVILDLSSDDPALWRRSAEMLCPIAQDNGAAFLLHGHPGLVREVGADGVHITHGAAAVESAMGTLKPDLIVGAGDCTTRHAAMLLGEGQPDYVLLGRLDLDGDIPATFNLIEWWSELFQLPCIAMCAEDWTSVEDAVSAGADFVAMRDLVWNEPAGVADAVARAAAIAERVREEAA
ncbi:thiamine phosphate synthase [Microbaculum sp. FT89]|uniref:thiamine phosphate synthase n=1 Tax=Microbaculum sp. FT89 TaxID=3447298 RepID=UPI003F52D136